MRLCVNAIGKRMPRWVEAGVAEYAGRLPRELEFELIELAPGHRGKGADIARAVEDEGQRMLAQVPDRAQVVALDERGSGWSTRELAGQLARWQEDARPVALLIGGPDGLSPVCRTHAAQTWSLSPLTLPHGMVRVLLIEQLYRAWSILTNHPYHRD